ncbi:hypothetical protein ACFO3J_05415 [Streptomyces polygonati]|uniref:Lipoprotein n=1 Tax=Streptomyces polygonati TaxID=1617087 RepID=A0ABV8HFK8_9ACTN
MRTRTPAGLAAVAAVLLLAGCGAGTAKPAHSAPARPACGNTVVTPGVTHDVCLDVGRTLRLALGRGDQPGAEKGAALTRVAPGVYRGARAGSAELSGFRHACPRAKPGGLSCHAIAGWTVTVRVVEAN